LSSAIQERWILASADAFAFAAFDASTKPRGTTATNRAIPARPHDEKLRTVKYDGALDSRS
jgi:hypothetical protein